MIFQADYQSFHVSWKCPRTSPKLDLVSETELLCTDSHPELTNRDPPCTKVTEEQENVSLLRENIP